MAIRGMGRMAGEECIPAFEPMDDTGAQQCIDGAINGDRSETAPFPAETLEDIVGADGVMRTGDLLEDAAPQVGETQAFLLKGTLRPRQRQRNAGCMIVPGGGKRGRRVWVCHVGNSGHSAWTACKGVTFDMGIV